MAIDKGMLAMIAKKTSALNEANRKCYIRFSCSTPKTHQACTTYKKIRTHAKNTGLVEEKKTKKKLIRNRSRKQQRESV